MDIAQEFAWKLPKSVLYWCICRVAVMCEPDECPADITAIEMLNILSTENHKTTEIPQSISIIDRNISK